MYDLSILLGCRECCGDAGFEQGLAKHALAREAAQLHYGEVLCCPRQPPSHMIALMQMPSTADATTVQGDIDGHGSQCASYACFRACKSAVTWVGDLLSRCLIWRPQMEALELLVDATAALIDRHVTDTLRAKHDLVGHCHAIKRYLLLSQARCAAHPCMRGYV